MEPEERPSPRLASKTEPPRLRAPGLRRDQLARAAEAERLRLLLVRAPAGYGKTNLVAAAAAELEWQCVWYRLDAADEDPASFLSSLAAAVRLRQPSLAETPACEAARAGASAVKLAARFAEALAQPGDDELFIVLDDYDLVEPVGRFDETITALLQLLPPTVHLVVLGRRRPAFATAKLELDGGLADITYRDLLLDHNQTAEAFEQQSGMTPTPAALETLLELTEGWAAGVMLAGRAARGTDPEKLEESLDDLAFERALLPYLAAEVYDGQPTEVREFLRQTCCLESMTVALAETVSASPDTRRLLEHVLEYELFTFADSSGAVRYHPLFRRFLEQRMIREEGADAYRALQRRSADALVTCGFVVAAVELYLALGEPQETQGLLRSGGTGLLDDCSDALLQRWAAALRSASTAGSSWAALIDGRGLFRRGHLASAREQLESAREALSGDASGRYMAHRALARHCYLTNADEAAVEHAREALAAATDGEQEAESLVMLAQTLSATCRWQELDETLAAFDALAEAPPKLTVEIAYLVVQRTHMTGDVRGALAAAETALPLARRHGTRDGVGSLLNGIASLNFFLACYGRATQHLAEAQKECAAHQLKKAGAQVRLTEAALLAQRGELDAALLALDKVAAERCAKEDAALMFEVEALRGTTLRRGGRLEAAVQASERAARIIASDGPPYDRLGARLDLAFTLHLSGADANAALQIQHLMDEAARMQFLFQYAKARLFLGIMSAAGDAPPAVDLGSPGAELVRLGHLDFLGQELAAYPQAARSLMGADIDEAALLHVLAAIACQARGPEVLTSLAKLSDHASLLVVEAARQRMPAKGRREMLAELRRHPSRRVRDRARRMLLEGEEGRLFPELTPREEEILALLAEGGTNREIAEQLSLTLATVKTHVHRILTRIEASGRLAAAVAYKRRAAASSPLPDESVSG